MKKIGYSIFLVVLTVILSFLFINKCNNRTFKESIHIRTVIDSTTVDSLKKVITRLEKIKNPDTVRVNIKVPSEPDTVFISQEGNEVKEYKTTHSDSIITANITTGVIGKLKYQNFDYSITHLPVKTVYKTKTLTKYRTKEKTIKRTIKPNSYLSAGIDIGGSKNQFLLYPKLSWTTSSGFSYQIKYGIQQQSILIGFSKPIRLNLPF